MMKIQQAGLSCDITGVPVDMLEGVWMQVLPMIDAAMEHNHEELTKYEILTALMNRSMQLWIAVADLDIIACAVTSIEIVGNITQCRYIVVAGSQMELWQDHSLAIDMWARSKGCTRMIAYCRPGFKKTVAQFGYKHLYDILSKDLTDITLH